MSHNHASCGAECEHNHDDDLTPAVQSSLYQYINFDAVHTFNEAESGSGKAVLRKSYEERLNDVPALESDADEQLLVVVPFTGQIKLHSVLIYPVSQQSSPSTVHIFANRDDLDFTSASDAQPTQTLEIPLADASSSNEVMELPVKRALFNNVRSLTLFFPDNQSGGDEDVTRITYLGFKGDWTKVNREPVIVNYEAAANPADHKIPGVKSGMAEGMGFEGGGTGDAN